MAGPTTAPKRKKRKLSVLKSIRQTTPRTERNRRNKAQLRRHIKALRRAIGGGNRAEAEKLLRPTISLIDRSIQKGILHRNAANRYKSRLLRRYQSLVAAAAR